MSKVILSMMVSLDGFTARADGDLDWFLSDDGFETEMLALLQSVDAMLFGRVSYELLSQYWPTAGTQDGEEAPGGFTKKERERAFADLMNSVPKVVYSKTLKDASWGPVTIASDVAADIVKRKAEAKKDLVLFAGAAIVSTFLELDLIDEVRLMVHPIILGEGIPLFRNGMPELALKLTRTVTFLSGVVLLQYTRDRSGVTT